MRPALLGVTLSLFSASGASAQQPTAQGPASLPPTAFLSVNPLGFLQLGPTAEAEIVAPPIGILGAFRVPSLGLVSHLIDPDLESAWMAGGSLRYYLEAEKAPAGLFLGPRVEAGRSVSAGDELSLIGVAGEFGWRKISSSGFWFSGGVMAGYFRSDLLTGVFVMAVLDVGVGF